jgi:hypothetical protein
MLLIGCGLNVPNMQPFAFTGDDAKVEGLKESSLTGYIKCEGLCTKVRRIQI